MESLLPKLKHYKETTRREALTQLRDLLKAECQHQASFVAFLNQYWASIVQTTLKMSLDTEGSVRQALLSLYQTLLQLKLSSSSAPPSHASSETDTKQEAWNASALKLWFPYQSFVLAVFESAISHRNPSTSQDGLALLSLFLQYLPNLLTLDGPSFSCLLKCLKSAQTMSRPLLDSTLRLYQCWLRNRNERKQSESQQHEKPAVVFEWSTKHQASPGTVASGRAWLDSLCVFLVNE